MNELPPRAPSDPVATPLQPGELAAAVAAARAARAAAERLQRMQHECQRLRARQAEQRFVAAAAAERLERRRRGWLGRWRQPDPHDVHLIDEARQVVDALELELVTAEQSASTLAAQAANDAQAGTRCDQLLAAAEAALLAGSDEIAAATQRLATQHARLREALAQVERLVPAAHDAVRQFGVHKSELWQTHGLVRGGFRVNTGNTRALSQWLSAQRVVATFAGELQRELARGDVDAATGGELALALASVRGDAAPTLATEAAVRGMRAAAASQHEWLRGVVESLLQHQRELRRQLRAAAEARENWLVAQSPH